MYIFLTQKTISKKQKKRCLWEKMYVWWGGGEVCVGIGKTYCHRKYKQCEIHVLKSFLSSPQALSFPLEK